MKDIQVLVLAVKYWFRGELWEESLRVAKKIVKEWK